MKKLIYIFLGLLIVACSSDDDDNTAPVVTLIGESSITVMQNDTYVDLGATAIDNVDGDLTSNISTTSNVDTSTLGTYTVTHSVSDASGNNGSASRQVVVMVQSLAIGQPYQGGIIAYIDSTGPHGLIAATADYNGTLNWDDAVSYCNGLTVGQYDDWYLPSKFELNLLYEQQTAIGGFTGGFYWSSTEYDNYGAWFQYFNDGAQGYDSKDDTGYVRAVRAF
jgi:hypothetical protein|tara:strand:+ start:433 stop:1098 length:666 start_codon:yes stop_codon:yes gene_type:complete